MIKLTAPNAYAATIAGEEWQNITPESYMWDEVQARIADGEEVIDLTGPQPPAIPEQMTFAQLLIGLVAENWISEAEGEAWLTGVVPAAVSSLIASLPEGQRFAALARASRPSVMMRSDPLVAAMADMQDKSQVEMDDFFSTYSAV